MTSRGKPHIQDVMDELLRTNFQAFAEKVFRTLNPGTEFIPGDYLAAISYALMGLERGDYRRLLVTIAPRTLKSLLINVAWTAWLLGHDPARKIISASYGLDLSHHMSLDVRRILESAWYRRIFPNVLDPRMLSKDEIRTRKLGFRLATSVGGTLTGRGGNILIVDDPLSADDGFSEAARERGWEWFTRSLMSRLDNPKTGLIAVISQRLHADDIPGRLIRAGGWRHLNLPMIAYEKQGIAISDNIVWSREPGESMHPERFGQPELDQMQKELAPEVWEAQYMQRPSPPGGYIFKLSDFQRYEQLSFKPFFFEAIVASVDTSLSSTTRADFTAATVWGIRGQDLYLLHAERGQWGFNDQLGLVERLTQTFKPHRIIVEQAASGHLLIEELRRTGYDTILGYNPKDDKIARAHAATAKIHYGKVFIPATDRPWLELFLHEVARFPNGKNDDWVDSMTQFFRSLDYGLKGIGLSVYHGQATVDAYLLG